MLDHDDELAPHALFEVVRYLQEHRDADLIYSDEDKIDESGERTDPHFKTGWSHDLAMEANYLNHFSVYRKTLLEELGGWREGFDGAQDLELVQRVGEKTDKIHRIPKVLYHWRAVTGSTAVSAEGKPYTHEKARRAIEESLERQGIAGTVEDSGLMPNTFRVWREVLGNPKVSVIVWSPGEPAGKLLDHLRERATYENHELLILDTENATLKGEKTERLPGTRLAELLNEAIRRAGGEYVALLGPDLGMISREWLEAMLQHAQREEVGVVGGKLMLPSGEVSTAGFYLTDETTGDGRPVLYRDYNRKEVGYELYFRLNRDCSAVSSRCMMFRKASFEEAGGFDEVHFGDAFADVDFCLRLRERGLSTIFTPYASFWDHGPQHGPAQPGPREAEYARQRWGNLLRRDPYHNPNLRWDPEDTGMIKGKPFAPGPAQKKKDEAAETTPKAKRVPLHGPRKTVEIPPPFFIVGHGRSGTTWLELTMNSHPEIACKGSGMFFGRDMPLYGDQRALPTALANTGDLKTWHDMRPNYWSRNTFEEDLPGLTKALADYTMGAELAESGKSLAGDRTPHYVSYLEELHELYPEAKVIHVIRDGRDVAISNIHAIWQNARDKGGPVDLEPEVQRKRDAYLEDRKKFFENGESIFTGYRINQLSESWRDAVNKGREDGRRLFGNRYTEVRYEDLLDDPHAELERLFGFLGVDDSEKVVGRAVEENRFEKVTGRQRGQEDPDHFNRKGVAGDWEEVFTNRDRRVFEEKAGETLAALGYGPDGATSRKPPTGEKPARGDAERTTPVTRRPAQAPPPFFIVGHGPFGDYVAGADAGHAPGGGVQGDRDVLRARHEPLRGAQDALLGTGEFRRPGNLARHAAQLLERPAFRGGVAGDGQGGGGSHPLLVPGRERYKGGRGSDAPPRLVPGRDPGPLPGGEGHPHHPGRPRRGNLEPARCLEQFPRPGRTRGPGAGRARSPRCLRTGSRGFPEEQREHLHRIPYRPTRGILACRRGQRSPGRPKALRRQLPGDPVRRPAGGLTCGTGPALRVPRSGPGRGGRRPGGRGEPVREAVLRPLQGPGGHEVFPQERHPRRLEERLQRAGQEGLQRKDGRPARGTRLREGPGLVSQPKAVEKGASRIEDVRFFAVGNGRSGTTWLERTLNTHPEVLCKGSGMFFGKDIRNFGGRRLLYEVLLHSEGLKSWHGMRMNEWTKEGEFEEDAALITRAAIDALMHRELAASGKRVLGDRTPHHVSYLGEVHDLYPEAKVIHAIRDGRDVAISSLHAFWRHSQDRGGPASISEEEAGMRDAYLEDPQAYLKSGRSIFTEERIRQQAVGWNRVVRRGRETSAKLFGDNYFELFYENHLDRPHETLTRLFGFLEADTSPAVVEKVVEANRFEKLTGRSRGQESSGAFMRKGVAGDWKGTFTERDRQVFKEEAGELLMELGYEKDLEW